ncbi:hypothetical protein E6W39_20345 [Kitasatospora acidiphila]|uniref:DUF6545 domain-containing protein n=1 Tax=Kitasatospora acidiphila TaxID=2567942 RepID=A0A540W534_9ACTN|nr:MAB_1171c family putative transporter [Kitasatospora acidiphila]TQF04149.1 hypothetical protein E6W39_20345 [Kitasatospora acidiphila]
MHPAGPQHLGPDLAGAAYSPYKLLIVALVGLVTLWRLPAAIRSPRQRPLWTAFAATTGLLALGLPWPAAWIDATSGVHNLAMLLKHQLDLVASSAGLTFCAQTARPDLAARWRRVRLAVLPAAQLGLVATFFTLHRPTEVADFYQAYPASTAAALYLLIIAGFIGAAMGVGSWLFGSHVRRAATRSLRAGLLVLALGTATGVAYSALRICQIALEAVGRPMFLDECWVLRIDWASITLMLLGSVIPAIGVALRGLRDWCTARRLVPLWRELTAAVPEVVLTERLGRGPRLRLHRLAIEIRDAALVLAGHADPEMRFQAAIVAVAAGPEQSALAEACWLRAAAALRRAGHVPVVPTAPAQTTGCEELDFATETDRLRSLAAAYASATAAEFARGATVDRGVAVAR